MRKILLCGIALLFIVFPVSAQDFVVPIKIDHKGDDRVGRSFAYEIREQFRESEVFTVSSEYPRMTLNLLTLASNEYPTSTKYSVTWTFEESEDTVLPRLMDHQLGTVRQNRLESSARDLVATSDEMRMIMRKIAEYAEKQ